MAKRPTSSSGSEQMERDKLARRNQKADGWGISLIFDDALLTLFQKDKRLRSCRSFSILEYRRDFEVTVDWTGVTLVLCVCVPTLNLRGFLPIGIYECISTQKRRRPAQLLLFW